MTANNQIQIFQSADGTVQLEVSLQQDTAWLTQAQIAELFQVKPQNITMHLKKIFADGELIETATCKDFLQVQNEGGRQVRRNLKHYNLDAIISVGYRVNSGRATQFRIWATEILTQYLVEGYTLNQTRLQERGIEFEQALHLLSETLANQQLVNPVGQAVLAVINDYARSWSLLQGYGAMGLIDYVNSQFDRSVTWDDLAWLIEQWDGPFVIKGLQSPADAKRAVDVGASAIMVSNHGGRQLDTTPAPIDCIAPIRDAIGDQLELIMDGGIRRGTHIIKALAQGADACSIGRPYLYGLAAGGQKGVERALSLLKAEVERDMALLGVSSISEIQGHHLIDRR